MRRRIHASQAALKQQPTSTQTWGGRCAAAVVVPLSRCACAFSDVVPERCGLWSKVLHDTHEHIDWYVEFDFVRLSLLWLVCRLPRFSSLRHTSTAMGMWSSTLSA
jgi:hypothetical protein